jgi:hypothetical protein
MAAEIEVEVILVFLIGLGAEGGGEGRTGRAMGQAQHAAFWLGRR